MDTIIASTEPSAETEQPEIIIPGHGPSVYVISVVVPVCVFMFLAVLIRRKIIRKRNMRGKVLRSSIYIIPDYYNQPKRIPEPALPNLDTRKQEKRKRQVKTKTTQKRKKQKNQETQLNLTYPREPIYKSQQNPSYIMPFSALPPNFDFSSNKVEVHSDFVIIKDMIILQTYWNDNELMKPQLTQNSYI